MKDNTKKQLDEAMQKEFNEVSTLDDYGMPAEVITIARNMIAEGKQISELMVAHLSNPQKMFEEMSALDPYQTIKYVMVNDDMHKLVDQLQELDCSLAGTREDIDEVARRQKMTVETLSMMVMLHSAMSGDE